MPIFSYKAVDGTGKNVTGTLVAESQQAALGMLDERALFPVEVVEGSELQKSSLLGNPRKVKLRHMVVFYSQLADLLRAGVPILRSLDVLSKQTSNALLAEIMREIREDVAGGMTLADALSKHPRVFAELHVAMVRAGERGGFLEDVLHRISLFVERQDELRNKLVGSLIYPCILVVVGTGLISMLLTWVVPQLRPFIVKANPNFLTLGVFAVSDFLKTYFLFVLMGLIIGISALVAYVRTEAGARNFDYWKLKTPILGPTLVMISLCRFCRILGTMLNSGVPILQALRISRDSAGNQILAAEIEKSTENVQKGGLMSEPLSHCTFFPLDIVDMIAVAEESNNLESVLVQIADTNEARTARMIDMGVRLIEPALLVLMAGVIAIIAIALLVPILSLSASMGGT